jgi:phosphohistidine phosphatase
MRRLMLLRHAKTERPEPGKHDRDRKLTKRGRSDAAAIGAYMVHDGLVPDLVLVSPAKRAEETWGILSAAFAPEVRVVCDERIYDASPATLIAVIGETHQAQSLLVVGHNPGLHEIAVQLITSGNVDARQCVSENLPTSGLVVIDIAFDNWSLLNRNPIAGRLDQFVSPRLIASNLV